MNVVIGTMLNTRISRPKIYHPVWLISDAITIFAAYWLGYGLRTFRFLVDWQRSLPFICFAILLNIGILYWQAIYRRIWHQTSGYEGISVIVAGGGIATIVLLLINQMFSPYPVPRSVIILAQFFSVISFIALRYRSRLITGLQWRWQHWQQVPDTKPALPRTLIAGAGESGYLLVLHANRIQPPNRHIHIIGFADDNQAKHGMLIEGVPVLGSLEAIPHLVSEHHIDLIVLALHHISSPRLREVLDICQRSDARVQVMPDMLAGTGQIPIFRDPRIEDIVGRSTIPMNVKLDMSAIHAKSILVTGAAGSIGAALARQLVQYQPACLYLLDNNETGLFDIEQELKQQHPQLALQVVLCDVTDKFALRGVFSTCTPQIVFHAAAYKHVPMMEEHPYEAIRVNLGGTLHVATMAQEYQTERFILISSDKAVNATSVMGATKYLGEQIVFGLAEQNSQAQTRMSAVRFGNVLGSRGSVVPIFERQIEAGGPVTVTDTEMTRYFMSIPEAAQLLLHAACLTNGHDLFILEMGERVKIIDLARQMIRLRGLRPEKDIPIVVTGRRSGEEIHERLLLPGESRQPTQHPAIFSIDLPMMDRSDLLEQIRHLVNTRIYEPSPILKAHILALTQAIQAV